MSHFKISRKEYYRLPNELKVSFWALVCGLLQRGLSTITTPIFTRLLSSAEFGQYNVYISWMSIISIFVSFNLYSSVYIQGLVKFDYEKKNFCSSFQGLSLTLSAIWIVFYFIFKDYWNKLFSLNTIQITALLLTIWSTSVFSFWLIFQRNENRFKAFTAITLVMSVFKPVLSIILIYNMKDKVTARILGNLIVDLTVGIVLFIVQIKACNQFFSKKYWVYGIKYNTPLVPHYLSQVVLNSSDRIMIEKMEGQTNAGIYSLAYSVSLLMTIINNALLHSFSPWMYKKIKNKDISSIAPIVYISIIGVAILNLIVILAAPEIIRLFAPPEYYNAIWIIPPVAISVYYMFIYDLFAKYAFYYEKRLFTTFSSSLAAATNIILNFIFIKKYGYIAAGYTTLICYILYAIGHYIFMNIVCKKYCDGVKPYSTKIIVLISGVFTLAGLSILFSYNYPYIRYAILAVFIIAAVLLRKKIIGFVRTVLSLRKA